MLWNSQLCLHTHGQLQIIPGTVQIYTGRDHIALILDKIDLHTQKVVARPDTGGYKPRHSVYTFMECLYHSFQLLHSLVCIEVDPVGCRHLFHSLGDRVSKLIFQLAVIILGCLYVVCQNGRIEGFEQRQRQLQIQCASACMLIAILILSHIGSF